MNSLRTIPVEELARDKSGIRTKYLRQAGYDNLANVFCSPVMTIASVYGISKDKAYTIKRKCNSYADKIRSDLKIKLSTDNKTTSSTKVVQAIFNYIKILELSKKIDSLKDNYETKLKECFASFNKVGNGTNLPFMTDSDIDKVKDNYICVNDILSNKYAPIINEYNNLKNSSINAEDAWNDFSLNSIKYYTIIEDVCPGILGNDDLRYGLPEDLAREIQDECFFPDGLLCTLRRYQEWGVKYILHQGKTLLGDEMGLGKTIQAIATMVSLKNTGATHFLVVCPASVVTNWCREIRKHSKLNVTKIYGAGKSNYFKSWLKTGGVAVTNYESTGSIELDDEFSFSLLVVDEAHYIKNSNA